MHVLRLKKILKTFNFLKVVWMHFCQNVADIGIFTHRSYATTATPAPYIKKCV